MYVGFNANLGVGDSVDEPTTINHRSDITVALCKI